MSETRQEVSESKIGGKIVQTSDVPKTQQAVAHVEASALNQEISSQQQSLGLGKYKARGLYAIVGLVFIALAYLLLQYFLRK
jgi:hypothetical protein